MLSAPLLLPFFLPFWGLLNPGLERIEKEMVALEVQRDTLPEIPVPEQENAVGMYMGGAFSSDASRWVQVDFGQVRVLDAVVVVPAYVASKWAYGFPLRYRVEASLTEDFAETVSILDRSGLDQAVPRGPVYIPVQELSVRYLRLTATRLDSHPLNPQRFIFCVGEFMAFSKGYNVALRGRVTAPGSAESLPTWSVGHIVDGSTPFGIAMRYDGLKGSNGWHSAVSKKQETLKWVQLDLGESLKLDEIRLVPARPSDFLERAGFGFPLQFRVELSESFDFESSVIVFDTESQDFINPGGNVVGFPVGGVKGRYVRVTATKLWQRHQDFVFALAEVEALSDGKNVALSSRVASLDETLTAAWKPEFLVDGRGSSGTMLDSRQWIADLAKRAELDEALKHLQEAVSKVRKVAETRGLSLLLVVSGAAVVGTLWRSRRVRRKKELALREQIARDLHDEIGSSLASIALMSERASRRADMSAFDEIGCLAVEASASMRGILWMLKGTEVPTIEELREILRGNATQMLGGIVWTFEGTLGDGECRVELPAHRDIFLFFKEVLHNIVRHSGARRVWILFGVERAVLQLRVRDDGCGFDLSGDFTRSGLANMKHRAEQLGARLTIDTTPSLGTTVLLEVPLS